MQPHCPNLSQQLQRLSIRTPHGRSMQTLPGPPHLQHSHVRCAVPGFMSYQLLIYARSKTSCQTEGCSTQPTSRQC